MSEYTLAHQTLKEAVTEWDAAQHARDIAEDDFRAAIRRALVDGVPVAYVALASRLSRSRVYQIRDGVR